MQTFLGIKETNASLLHLLLPFISQFPPILSAFFDRMSPVSSTRLRGGPPFDPPTVPLPDLPKSASSNSKSGNRLSQDGNESPVYGKTAPVFAQPGEC